MEKQSANEKIGIQSSYKFFNILPGGNGTTLVESIVSCPIERKRINDALMTLYPDLIEQVGFIDISDPQQNKLIMAGGEFCGNATRSTAYIALGGKPGEILLTVSGVQDKLKAGVTESGEAFAQMPIYPELDRVEKDSKNPNASTVYLQGITQYVVWNDLNIIGMNQDEIKAYAQQLLKEKEYDVAYPASGVMFVSETNKGLELKPVVYVRDINTHFFETACGSGTAAIGLVLAKEKQNSINELPIYQPSGLPIRITVNYDKKQGQSVYAQISGPIQVVNEGTLIESVRGPYVIEKVDNLKSLAALFCNDKLMESYGVFSQPPYNEQFTNYEIRKIFLEYVKSGLLFVARSEKQVVGFGAAIPISECNEIALLAEPFNIPLEDTWYMADLGVIAQRRREGIARQLVLARLDAIPKGSTVLMRTSTENTASQTLYRSLGFTQIEGMIQNVTQQRTDRTTQTDRRIFLVKTI